MSALFIVSNFAQLSCGSAKKSFYSSLLSLMLFLPFLPSLAFCKSFALPHHPYGIFFSCSKPSGFPRWDEGLGKRCPAGGEGGEISQLSSSSPSLPSAPVIIKPLRCVYFLSSLTHTKSRCWDWNRTLLPYFSPPLPFPVHTLLSLRPLPPAAVKTFKRKNGTCWQEAGKQGTFNWAPAWKQRPGKGPTNTSDVKHRVTEQRGKKCILVKPQWGCTCSKRL